MYGCYFNSTNSTAASCTSAAQPYNVYAALDGGVFNAIHGVMSMPITDPKSYWRYQYVYYQVALAQALSDVAAVEIYTLTAGNWSSQYSSALSVYLSPTENYLCPTCGIACVTNWNASLNAPAANIAACALTLNNTRYVTVHKPLGTVTGGDRLYILEMRVMRMAQQACQVPCSEFDGRSMSTLITAVNTHPGLLNSSYSGFDAIQDGYLAPLYSNVGVQTTAASTNWVQVQVSACGCHGPACIAIPPVRPPTPPAPPRPACIHMVQEISSRSMMQAVEFAAGAG